MVSFFTIICIVRYSMCEEKLLLGILQESWRIIIYYFGNIMMLCIIYIIFLCFNKSEFLISIIKSLVLKEEI